MGTSNRTGAVRCGFALGAALTAMPALALDLDVYGGAGYLYLESTIDTATDLPPGNPTRPDTVQRLVRSEADGGAIMAHLGVWLSESFALEVRGGFPLDDAEFDDASNPQYRGNTAEIEEMVGVYLMARAQPLSWLDAMFPVGMSQVKVAMPSETDGDATNGPDAIVSADATSISYGIDLRWRLGTLFFDEDSLLGSISVNTGFMVYADDNDLESRGYNGSLQIGYQF
ncbi:MAG: hypothetical protein ABF296_10980 [Oceanococcaceae bacterium]